MTTPARRPPNVNQDFPLRPRISAAEYAAVLRWRRRGALPTVPEPTPHRANDERVEAQGRKASTVSCVRCPHCRVLLHVGNIIQRRYRARLVREGRCVVCTHANPDRRYRVCPGCRAASRARWSDRRQEAS